MFVEQLQARRRALRGGRARPDAASSPSSSTTARRKLTLKERFIYAQAPVDTRTDTQLQDFLDWTSSHALTGRAGRPWFLDEVDGHSRLDRMEQALRACTLWLWLDLRFPGVYGHVDEVHGAAQPAQRRHRAPAQGQAPAGADAPRRPARRRAAPRMKAPPRLQSLIDEGLIDTVVRQLMSGKEAMVFVVRCGDETRCAKVYKEATQRSFRQAVDYTENRKVKNTRQARAMAKGTRFGRAGAGSGLAERRGRRAVPPGRGRRARAQALQLPRRRAADGAGGRRERRRRAAPERRRLHARARRAPTTPRC